MLNKVVCNILMLIYFLHRASYFVLFVEELGARSSSTKFLSDVLHDDSTACAISCHRHITHCRYLGSYFINVITIVSSVRHEGSLGTKF